MMKKIVKKFWNFILRILFMKISILQFVAFLVIFNLSVGLLILILAFVCWSNPCPRGPGAKVFNEWTSQQGSDKISCGFDLRTGTIYRVTCYIKLTGEDVEKYLKDLKFERIELHGGITVSGLVSLLDNPYIESIEFVEQISNQEVVRFRAYRLQEFFPYAQESLLNEKGQPPKLFRTVIKEFLLKKYSDNLTQEYSPEDDAECWQLIRE